MNIHFTDRELFDQLKKATLAKIKVGSHMYGTNTEQSDIDYLYIYATSENELLSAIQTHHQLQYIDIDGNDHNFVSLHTFIKNILNGDSTINFEVVQSNGLFGTNLDWITKNKDAFITYTIIRSYLGLARRDIKHFHKANTDYLKKKCLGHIIRGYIYARDMIYDQWNFSLANVELKTIIETLDVTNNKTLREYEAAISDLRNELNDKFNNKKLGRAQHMNVDDSICFTSDLLDFCKSNIFKQKQKNLIDFNLDKFLHAFEHWVEY